MKKINRRPVWVHTSFGIVVILLLGFIDYATGPEISFSIFYLIPISLVAWFAGRGMGMFVSVISAGVWLYVDILTHEAYSSALIPFWNSVMRLGFYSIVTYLLSSLKLLNEELEHKVEERTGNLSFEIAERKKIEEALREHKKRLQTIFDTEPHSVMMLDKQGIVLQINPAGLELIEADNADTIVGKSFYRFIPAQRRNDFVELIEFAVIGNDGNLEFYITGLKGIVRRAETHVVPFRNAQNEITGVLAITSDITERKRAQNALVESEQQYRTLVERMSEGLLQVDNDDIIQFANDRFCTMLGYYRGELIGKSASEIFIAKEEDKAKIHEKNALRRKGISDLYEIQMRKKSGEDIWVQIGGAPVLDSTGSVTGSIGVHVDITEQKKLEEQLRQSQKMESVGILAGGIAHNFNNILSIILGYASLMEREHVHSEKISKGIEAIIKAGERGALVIRQLLTFARRSNVVFEPMNVSSTIEEVIAMLKETFPKTIAISSELTGNIPPMMGDANQIHQACINICLNALDAMPKGGTLSFRTMPVTGEILRQKFKNAAESEYVSITIADTGVGMDEKTRERIFEPFFTLKSQGKGTGLGLSLVYGIIENHHGFIEVESEPARGSAFNIYFPIHHSSVSVRKSAAEKRKQDHLTPATILVVEDEELLIALTKNVLEEHGYSVLEAKTGTEAIEIYRTHNKNISIVLTDIGLPSMSGGDVYFKMREINPMVKPIICSGNIDPHLKYELQQAGVKHFLHKPYDYQTLLHLIQEMVEE